MLQLDITGPQVKSPMPVKSHLYWSCWPVGSHRFPQIMFTIPIALGYSPELKVSPYC